MAEKKCSLIDGQGNLQLLATKEADGTYGTGAVNTKGKFEHKHGLWVARMQMPKQPGFWSAFWLMGNTVGKVGNEGMDGTEIDVIDYIRVYDLEGAAPPVTEKDKTSTNDPLIAQELRVRDGLPNLFAKLKAGGPVRIAYLGGSITAAEGWRVKTTAWFKAQYPKTEIIEINAAISGTGSDYGACRIASDVLERSPDLVFMEHRVNGDGGFEAKSVEGIVRQIWQASPHTDIFR